ncbi:site-2 protease. Metallo peptidase. MEROPS family M50B [bacterium A37T11]|nr:site-2 protease. Metallo peptidase. MEROPS family M50B [bacterium A37T11]
MDIVIMVGQFILGLSILIVLHELGHFLAARAFGIKVEKFYLFFDAWGVKLFKFTHKGVEYGIGWLPLGGYVKIAGMIDESMDTEQLAGPVQPWEFRAKPAWQRLIVMLAGIAVNIALGIFIFWMMVLRFGENYRDNNLLVDGVVPGKIGKAVGILPGDKILEIDGVKIVRFEDLLSSKVLLGNSRLTIERAGKTEYLTIPSDVLNMVADDGIEEFVEPRVKVTPIAAVVKGSAAEKGGLKTGDVVVKVNDQPYAFWDELRNGVSSNAGKDLTLTVLRDKQEVPLQLHVPANGILGFQITDEQAKLYKKIDYGFWAALPIGASKAWGSLLDNAKGLGKVVKGEVNPRKALAGPVGIARMFGSHVDWVKFWSLVGLLSMALALMNLLPIPALDGGHALFLIVEMITGKPLSDKFMEKAQVVGFVIIVALMVFVMGNDILKAIGIK